MAKNDLKIQIDVEANKAQTQIKNLNSSLNTIGTKGVKSFEIMRSKLDVLAHSLQSTYFAVQGLGAVANSIKSGINTFAQYEASMNKLKAISGASSEEFAKLDKRAKSLGESTKYTASQVSEGMNFLAMAGFKTKEINSSIGGSKDNHIVAIYEYANKKYKVVLKKTDVLEIYIQSISKGSDVK